MPLVTAFVENAASQLDAVAQTGFNAVANAINDTAAAAATVALAVLAINMIFQLRPMPVSGIIWTMAKLVLISAIGLQWSGFSTYAYAVQSGMDSMAGALIGQFGGDVTGAAGGGDAGAVTLATAIDRFISDFATASNTALEPMSWTAGAFMSLLITFLMSIVAAGAALIIVFSKVMITVYLSIAPIFITCWIFETTKDYFNRWLQATVSYMLYPVVVATVLGGMIRIISGFVGTLSINPTGSISEFIPFVACMIIMVVSIIFIPRIVDSLSGMLASASPFAAAVAGAAMGTVAARGTGATLGKARELAPLAAAGAKQQVVNVASALNRAENVAGKAWSRNRKY